MSMTSRSRHRHPFTRAAHRLAVWCLLVALPLYGVSAALVQLLGARHLHAAPAVHAVGSLHGWHDLRRRLAADRRCYGFFHPSLPDEPLIFVEVALVPEMPAAVAPLIDKTSRSADPDTYKVATFYSISNCQPGLKGVSLGNFLIKRVADELKREVPQLRTFCTLSPIPGSPPNLAALPPDWRARIDHAAASTLPLAARDLPQLQGPALGRGLKAAEAAWIASGFAAPAPALIDAALLAAEQEEG